MRILIESILHSAQRYDTCGDWWIDADGTWQIRVSQMPSPNATKHMLLIVLHELIEMALCQYRGITDKDVDDFDMTWKPRVVEVGDSPYETVLDDEPGNDPKAPYYHEHQFASGVERILAAELDVDWGEYERSIENLE